MNSSTRSQRTRPIDFIGLQVFTQIQSEELASQNLLTSARVYADLHRLANLTPELLEKTRALLTFLDNPASKKSDLSYYVDDLRFVLEKAPASI